MSRQYNQKNADGSWTMVTANDDGTYTSVPISDPTVTTPPAADQSYSYDPGAASAATAATNAATSAAAEKASEVYQQWQMRTGDDRLAFEKATEAWNETFKQSQANNANTLDYLGLIGKYAGGPANAFNYAHLLTGTPGGLADIVRAAGGAYRLPAFGGGAGGSSVPLSIQSMINDVGAYSPTAQGAPVAGTPAATGQAPSGPAQYATKNGPKTVAQMGAELKTAGWGGDTSNADAVLAQYPKTAGGTVTPMAANVDTSGSHTMLPSPTSEPSGGKYIPSFGALPTSGNQFSPQNMSKMDPSQTALLGAAYGDQGYIWNDLLSQYQKSLRAYGGPSRGGVGF